MTSSGITPSSPPPSRRTDADAFNWPPSSSDRDHAAGPAHDQTRGMPSSVGRDSTTPSSAIDRGWLRAIAREWFGQTRASLPLRLRDAGWSPDAPGTWCRRCGEPAGPYEVSNQGDESTPSNRGTDDRCPACRTRRLSWERAVRVGPYAGVLRDALLEAKATGWRRLAFDLGTLVAPSLLEAMREDDVDRSRCVLVPVPTPWSRVATGSIDHTLCMCRGLRAATGVPIVRILSARGGPKQIAVTASARKTNLRGRLRARHRVVSRMLRTQPQPIVLVVDDIRTTGATMTASCKAIQNAVKAAEPGDQTPVPLSLWCVTAAVTEPKNRRPGSQPAKTNP